MHISFILCHSPSIAFAIKVLFSRNIYRNIRLNFCCYIVLQWKGPSPYMRLTFSLKTRLNQDKSWWELLTCFTLTATFTDLYSVGRTCKKLLGVMHDKTYRTTKKTVTVRTYLKDHTDTHTVRDSTTRHEFKDLFFQVNQNVCISYIFYDKLHFCSA